MPPILSKAEAMLALALAVLSAAAAGPLLPQSPHYHDFADQRVLFDVMYAMDVFSNAAFALGGLIGLVVLALAPARSLTNMQRAMALMFFSGLVLVALGSATYHLAPGDDGLAIDRVCMAVAMAGLLGIAAAGHISERAGAILGSLALAAGIASVNIWSATGNLLPWSVFQLGAVGLLWWMATLAPNLRALPVNWALVIVAYGVAKLLELNDYAVYEFTYHLVSGHTLKHLVAAAAAWPVIRSVIALGKTSEDARARLQDIGGLNMRWSNT